MVELNKHILKSADACKILRLSSAHLRLLAQKGRLKSYRPNANGHRYYSMQDINTFLETHERKSYYKPLNGDMGYTTAHNRIKEHYGKANKCEFNPKHKAKYVWANIGHTYKRNCNDWIQLCPQCHWQLDHPNGRLPIRSRSSRNSKSEMVSFRLQNKDVSHILTLYKKTMSISSCCRQIIFDHLQTV